MRTFLLLCRHQLRLVYRDRNTRVYGLLLPLVLYPLLLLFALQGKLVLSGLSRARHSRVILALGGASPRAARIREALKPSDRIHFLSGRAFTASPQKALLEGKADAALTEKAGGRPLRLLLLSGAPASETAARRIRNLLSRIQEGILSFYRIPPPPRPVLRILDLSPGGKTAGVVLGRILPLILFVMVSLGAFFPAMEATAGEWERSTLETSLLLPVRRETLLASRVTAVALASVSTAGLNLLGMLLSAGPFLGRGGGGLPPISAQGILVLALLGILLALFFASAFLLVCSRARTFREGQAFGTPLLALAMLPGLVPLLPGILPGDPLWNLPLAGEALAVQAACSDGFRITGSILLVLGRAFLLDAVLLFAALRFMERRILPGDGKEVALR